MTPGDAERLQQGLAAWARTQPTWRALAVVGSWARLQARADSDLDLMALVQDLDRWTADAGWLARALEGTGLALASLAAETHGVARTWRVRLAGGAELDLTLAAIAWAGTDPLDPGTRRVIGDGLRSLVDKDGLLSALEAAAQEGN